MQLYLQLYHLKGLESHRNCSEQRQKMGEFATLSNRPML